MRSWLKETLIIVIMVTCFVAPMFWLGIPLFGWYFATSMLMLFIFEGIALYTSWKKTGTPLTLSRMFMEAAKRNKKKAVVALVVLSTGWGILIWHLLERT
jgi:hypothetical protein